jgi:methionyl-tRNA formyltransferase
MGTPEFAVASLDRLYQAGCHIVGVVTAPDKPAGRGMQLQESAVKKYAVAHQLPVLQPEKLRDPAFLEALKALRADLQVVVAFRMLPEMVWNMPPMGTVNLHGSLLPQYRGAAPINWAIINGEKETGVTTFKLQHAIDTGDLLLHDRIAISDSMTAGELHDTMKEVGAALLLKTVEGLANDTIQPVPQQQTDNLRHAPKLFTETCSIDWQQSATTVYNLIRGLSPYPAAFTKLEGRTLKIFKAVKEDFRGTPGQYYSDQKTYLYYATADGAISLLDVQLEGKKRLAIADFLRGYRFVTPVSEASR